MTLFYFFTLFRVSSSVFLSIIFFYLFILRQVFILWIVPFSLRISGEEFGHRAIKVTGECLGFLTDGRT